MSRGHRLSGRGFFHLEMSGAELARRAKTQWSEGETEKLADPKDKQRRAVKRAGDKLSEHAAKRKPFLS